MVPSTETLCTIGHAYGRLHCAVCSRCSCPVLNFLMVDEIQCQRFAKFAT